MQKTIDRMAAQRKIFGLINGCIRLKQANKKRDAYASRFMNLFGQWMPDPKKPISAAFVFDTVKAGQEWGKFELRINVLMLQHVRECYSHSVSSRY